MKKITLLRVDIICFLVMGLCLLGTPYTSLLRAADYPNKTITIIVPMVAGGQFDLSARVVADAMEKQLKQPVVVVNKTGASGTVGGYAVASAKPDGYTLGYFHNTPVAPEVYSYFYAAPYSSNDLKPIFRGHQLLNVITVREDAPYNTMKEFVEYARKNPGIKYAHNGKASLQYLVMSTIAKAEKLSLVDVPYDGDGAILPALLGGHIPMAIPAYSGIKPLVTAKKFKLLASCTEKRTPFTPDVPSLVELGYKLPYTISVSLYGPKKLPDEVVRKLNDVMGKIVADKDFQKKNADMDMILAYENSDALQKEMDDFKQNVTDFLKDQGLVKK
jgi:tripartite-type tricarboxylate transporter receptor subunit TctC